MLQTALGQMILVINVVLVIWVSQHAAGFTTTECEIIGDVNSSLEQAEALIQKARKKLPTDIQSSLPKDCNDLLNNGEKKSGVYLVWPINRILSESIPVYCDMNTDGGGWTVIQRRGNFSRDKDFFNQDWKDYKEGFGNLEEDFWLGNDYIYALSNQKLYSIRFDLGDVEGSRRYAVYDRFWIEDESNNYKLHVAGYKGDASDSFSHHSSCMFSTKDRDNDNSDRDCGKVYQAGWWFKDCFQVNLNGKYIPGKVKPETRYKGIHWMLWNGELESLATAEIKIRTNPSWVK